MKRTIISLLCVLSLMWTGLCVPGGSLAEAPDASSLYKKKDVNADWDEKNATVVDLSALTEACEISRDGDYVLRGETSFPVVVNAAEDDDVRLILDGASITAASGPAIRENAADKLIITLADGSVNTLVSQAALEENGEKYSAALYAKDDLSLNGAGTLKIESAGGHGVQSKADLIIAGGVLEITSAKDGLRGKNSVTLLGGDISVTAGGDGITTTQENKPEKGWIMMLDGTVNITTGSGAGEAISLDTGMGGMQPDGRGGFGGRGGWKKRETVKTADTPSQKGIKAMTSLTVLGGTLNLNCADDALHAASITVSGGTLDLRTGDDAMHADGELTVSGGTVNIPVCKEGLEGLKVNVSGGTISVVSSDDGINASNSAADGRGDDGSLLTVSGGSLFLTAGNDGLDSNGSIALSGGVIGIWTAQNAMDGPIDCNGEAKQTGGTLIIATLSESRTIATPFEGQPIMAVTLEQAAEAGSPIGLYTLADGAEKELAAFTPLGSFLSVFVSSDSLREGDPCVIKVKDAEVFNGTMSANVTTGVTAGRGGRGGRMGAPFGQVPPADGTPEDAPEGEVGPAGRFPGGRGGHRHP